MARKGQLALFAIVLSQMNGFSATYSGVEYSRPDGQSLLLDAQVPDGAGPFPAVIIVHGGAWVTGDRRVSVQPLFEPLSSAGIAWFSISYRLANVADPDSLANALGSATAVSHAIDDVRQAVAYVKNHAAEYNVDPARIVLIGESAGAQLASMAVLKPGMNTPVQAVVAFYSPSDLAAIVQNSPRIPAAVRNRFKGTPFELMLMNLLRDLSPVRYIHANAPPFLLIHGTADALVPFQQSVDFCQAIRETMGVCDLYEVAGGGHGMRWWESRPDQTGYKAPMIRWLRARLNLK